MRRSHTLPVQNANIPQIGPTSTKQRKIVTGNEIPMFGSVVVGCDKKRKDKSYSEDVSFAAGRNVSRYIPELKDDIARALASRATVYS